MSPNVITEVDVRPEDAFEKALERIAELERENILLHTALER